MIHCPVGWAYSAISLDDNVKNETTIAAFKKRIEGLVFDHLHLQYMPLFFAK